MSEARQERLDRLCNDYLDARMYAEKHKENADALRGEILAMQPENSELTGLSITKPRASFDAATAGEILTAEQLAAITETRISGARAKQVLPPAVYAACCRVSSEPGLRAT